MMDSLHGQCCCWLLLGIRILFAISRWRLLPPLTEGAQWAGSRPSWPCCQPADGPIYDELTSQIAVIRCCTPIATRVCLRWLVGENAWRIVIKLIAVRFHHLPDHSGWEAVCLYNPRTNAASHVMAPGEWRSPVSAGLTS